MLTIYMGHSQFNNDAPWMQELQKQKRTSKSKSSISNENFKFQEIVGAFNEYWKDKDHTTKGSGYKPFKRWEYFWKDRLNDDGTLVTTSQVNSTMSQNKAFKNNKVDASNWIALGPTDFKNRSWHTSNIGRINAIAVDPNNNQVYYAGTPAGGIWRSNDAGANWEPLSDELPQLGVSAIAIDPTNSNTIYIGTGDDDNYNSYSTGLLKSTDGGQTWNTTALVFNDTSSSINEVYLDRSNGNNKVFVSTNRGFYKSTDGGVSFTKTLNVDLKDMKLKPGNSNVIYAVSHSDVYKSTDNGDSFTQLTTANGLPKKSNRLVLGVSAANPSYVYVLSTDSSGNFQGLYKSTNSGASFVKTAYYVRTWNTDIFDSSEQSWYNLALTVSETNAEEVYVGCLTVWKSIDGGDSFIRVSRSNARTASYTHADIHFLRFFNGELFCGSDGGIFRSTDGGKSFTDLTNGMHIGQFYKIAVSKQNPNKMTGGSQDNGSFGLTSNGEWNIYAGSDGMDTAIDPNNENNYYGFMQHGKRLWISTNAGDSQTSNVSMPRGLTELGNWVTPLAMNKDSELYAGYDALYRLDGNSFTRVSSRFKNNINELEIDPTNPDNMFLSWGTGKYLNKSENRGISFTHVYTFPNTIKSIEVHSSDSNIVYVVTNGASGKVYKSTDGGENFSDITGNLPAIPKSVIVHQGNHKDNPLFVGTISGVYRTDDTMSDWAAFDTNLPNSPITDLEINLVGGNITAATFGRGIWRSTITAPVINICKDGIQNGDETGVDCGGSCKPCDTSSVYCEVKASSSDAEYISRVQLGSIDNSSLGASGGYNDFTSISTDISKGVSNTITITPKWKSTKQDEAYAVWVDYNQDGVFGSGELVWSKTASTITPVIGTFIVPDEAKEGATRMRVIMKYKYMPTSCESFKYGEVEDYTITIGTNDDNGVIYVNMNDITANSSKPWNYFTIEVGDDNGYGAWFSRNATHFITYDKDVVCEGSTSNVSLIGEGVEVGSSSNFVAKHHAYSVSSSSYTKWRGQSGYIGFTFKINGNTHYGWFYASVSNDGLSYTITDYAYNTKPGQSLKTIRKTSKNSVLKTNRITIYPNPFSESVNINLSKIGNEPLTIIINDLLGKSVFEKEYSKNPGELSVGETITQSGNYIVKIISKSLTEVYTIVKQ